jgi:hypothetical protein
MPEEPTPARVRVQVDPSRSTFVTIFGRKGSGKSVLARRFWSTWPYDRLAIDPHNDLADDETTRLIHDPLPLRLPGPVGDQERASLRYVPDMGSANHQDDMDRAVGLAFNHRRTLLWIDEVGDLTSANRTPPYMRRALHAGRHRDLSMLMCMPRPIDIDPLVISQADQIFFFHMPHTRDRERAAGTIGVARKDFDVAMDGLGEFEYLRYEMKTHELVHFPKLPHGGRPPESAREAHHATRRAGRMVSESP